MVSRRWPSQYALCDNKAAMPVELAAEFEYRTSADPFLARRCMQCALVFLDPRPAGCEFGRIYPPHHHALAFKRESFGLFHRVRERLEAKGMSAATRSLPADAKMLDGPGGRLCLGDEGRNVLLHKAVKGGQFPAVALAVDRGCVRTRWTRPQDRPCQWRPRPRGALGSWVKGPRPVPSSLPSTARRRGV
jgi:hypothetical protein